MRNGFGGRAAGAAALSAREHRQKGKRNEVKYGGEF